MSKAISTLLDKNQIFNARANYLLKNCEELLEFYDEGNLKIGFLNTNNPNNILQIFLIKVW